GTHECGWAMRFGYFAWPGAFDIVWCSDPDSRHSRNLTANRSAAITIYDSDQTWGGLSLPGQNADSAQRTASAADGAGRTAIKSSFPHAAGDNLWYAPEPHRGALVKGSSCEWALQLKGPLASLRLTYC